MLGCAAKAILPNMNSSISTGFRLFRRWGAIVIFAAVAARGAIVEDEGKLLARTPPMGWNSWNMFGPGVNVEVVRRVADEMVELGLQNLAYNYVGIDDHWEGGRD